MTDLVNSMKLTYVRDKLLGNGILPSNNYEDTEEYIDYFKNVSLCKNLKCSEYENNFIGVLTYDEAKFTGVNCEVTNFHTILSDRGVFCLSATYLNDGDSTLLSGSQYDYSHYYFTGVEYVDDYNNYGEGFVEFIDIRNNNYARYCVRPIIVLNTEKWKIKGTGKEGDPYQLKSII